MNCEICGLGPREGVGIRRINETGVKGIWRCDDHFQLPPEAMVEDGSGMETVIQAVKQHNREVRERAERKRRQ